jgi:thermolysin
MRRPWLLLTLAAVAASPALAEPREVRVRASGAAEVAAAQGPIESLLGRGELRIRLVQEDTQLPGRRHERLSQSHRGVPVWGAELARQLDPRGRVASIFGSYHEGIDVPTLPALTADQARAAVRGAGARPLAAAAPSLAILPRGGDYRLVWTLAGARPGDVRQYFVDAQTGTLLRDSSLLHKQASGVGRGRGVLNNDQKLSVTGTGGDFLAQDLLRPARLTTFDMKGDPDRTFAVVLGEEALGPADIARDADNDWTDGIVVDAHAYTGITYDYFFKRHGRRSWNDADAPIRALVHPVRLEDFDGYVASGEIFGDLQLLYINAFFCCSGSLLPLGGFMVYGEGVPEGNRFGLEFRPFAASFDVVAHEVTHGMTAFTSGLTGNLEALALNESFSDIMAVGADFYLRGAAANYRVGEELTPGGFRSLSNPGEFGDADHVAALRDANFEEHSLASLSNHAFYLAVEGGTNRTSGIAVQGVGGANRDQIERAFYRAYQFMLTTNSGYCDATAATILAAGQLHGAGSRAAQAITQAWTAVGLVGFCF